MHFISVSVHVLHDEDWTNPRYQLMVSTPLPSPWVKRGIYQTIDEVLDAFTPHLNAEYERKVRTELGDGRPSSFSLESAY